MERRSFFKRTLLATGGLLLGGATIHRFLIEKDQKDSPLPPTIERIHLGSKKNVLVLMSSGTRHGNTDQLTDAYIKGLVERDYSVTKVYLGSMTIDGCRGCGACQRNVNKRCVIRDGMQDIYPLFSECDTLVLASPLYFWTITAKLKSFIERLYAISIEDKYPSKDMVLLMTAGDDDEKTFEHPLHYYRLISKVFGGNDKGTYCAGDCTGCEELARKIDNKHLDKAYEMALEL